MRINVLPDLGIPGQAKTAVIEIGFEDKDTNVAGEATGVVLPANCLATFRPVVTEAFNSGTSDTLTVGKTGTLDAYLSNANIGGGTPGVKSAQGPYHITTATEVVFDYQSVGMAPTAGRLLVAIDIVRIAA